jgi:hypothetical protein
VGTLEGHDHKLIGHILIPMDGLPSILQMLIGNRFKYLYMSGSELYRRRTPLTGFSLEMILTDEESGPSTG